MEGFSLKKAGFPFSRGKNRISQGVENRGSLISVPLALRDGPFLEFCAKPDNQNRNRNACKQKGFRAIKRGPVPVTGPSVPLTGPLVPLTGALFNCRIVGHSLGFNCIGLRGASKNIGLGRT